MPEPLSLWERIKRRTQIGTFNLSTDYASRGEPEFIKGKTEKLPDIPLIPTSMNNQPVFVDWSTENAVKNGYKVSDAVYACVTKLMKAAASVPWVVRERKGDTFETNYDHPISQLFRWPNPFATFQDQTEMITSHLNLGGNAFFMKVRVAGKPAELWIIRPDFIRPVYTVTNYLSYYQYSIGSAKYKIDPEDIIHFMFINPANPFWGISPMQCGSKSIDIDVESMNFNKVGLQNRGVPDGVISFNQSMSQDQVTDARESIRESYLGPDNARTPLVLSAEAKWQRTSQTPAELDFLKGQVWTVERICSTFGVPPPLIGHYEKATLANIQTARLIFWLDTVIPYLDDLKGCYNHGLAREWSEDGSIIIDYDLSRVQAIQSLFADKVNAGKTLFQMGVPFNTINQRLELGFEPLDNGDIGYVPTTMIPADPFADSDLQPAKSNKEKSDTPDKAPPWPKT